MTLRGIHLADESREVSGPVKGGGWSLGFSL